MKKRDGLSKIPIYDLADNVCREDWKRKERIVRNNQKKHCQNQLRNLKELSQAIHSVKESIEEEDVEKTLELFEVFIDPAKSGEQMIENFFDEHREIRLWKIRIKDRGVDYIIDNKESMLVLFNNIEGTVTKKLRSEID